MNRVVLSAFYLLMAFQLQAQRPSAAATDKLPAGAALLFRNVQSALPASEKARVYASLNIHLAADGKSFTLGDYPVDTYVYPTDLNGDGREDLFVGLGSAAMFGNTGENFQLFLADPAGKYLAQPDIGGGRPLIMNTKSLGYPDIVIGGPGFEFPLYRWNGRKYSWSKKIKDGSLNEKNSADIDAYSKAYLARRR